MHNIFCLFLFFSFSELYSDLLTLKSGEVLEGTFVSEKEKTIQFEVSGKVQEVFKKNIKSLELGYVGTPFCYKKVNEVENCQTILFSVDDKKIVLAKGKGFTEKEEISLQDLEYFYSENLSKKDKITNQIKPKAEIEVLSSKGEWRGRVKKYDLTKGTISLEVEGQAEVLELQEDELIRFRWRPKKPFDWKKLPPMAIPGVYQFSYNKWKGATMSVFCLLFAVMIPIEYQNAQTALNNDQTILYFNNNVYIVSGFGSNPAFETHKRNMNLAIFGLSALMTYHVVDVYLTEKNLQGPQTKFQLQIQPHEFFALNTNLHNFQKEMNISLKFSYSF
jgi:hypothetical protein